MLRSSRDPELSEDDWAALTTVNQFRALGIYAEYCRRQTTSWRIYRDSLRIRPKSRIDTASVRQQLMNSWNTERLLRATSKNFAGPGSGFVSQWAFPQCYYSTFNSTLASFASSGFTETSHTAVRRKVSELASRKALPCNLNVFVDGGMNDLRIEGISSTELDFNSARMNVANFEQVKRHLISFFRTTRRMHLEDKKPDLKIRTKDGKQLKKALSKADWKKVSQALGRTSWLCLLYRKRIKSNYRDIDTFLSDRFDTHQVLDGLVSFTDVFNMTNEINIISHLGDNTVRQWIPNGADFVARRLEVIQTLPGFYSIKPR